MNYNLSGDLDTLKGCLSEILLYGSIGLLISVLVYILFFSKNKIEEIDHAERIPSNQTTIQKER